MTKQLIMAVVCHCIAVGTVAYGAYEFYLEQLAVPELTRLFAVAVFLLAWGSTLICFLLPSTK